MTKILTQPLLLLLLLMIAAVVTSSIARRVRGGAAQSVRGLSLIVIWSSVLVLAALSTPAVGFAFRDSVAIPASQLASPDYVVVLSGGYSAGASPDLDTLSEETTRRVLTGVHYWKQHTSTRLVMTGVVPRTARSNGRITELMAEMAICHGVPFGAIILETAAMNTRDHPRRLRQLPGIGAGSRLAVVTSREAERRAIIEFRRYFVHVAAEPVPDPSSLSTNSWREWLPQNDGLVVSTLALQEWIGIVWYRILAFSDGSGPLNR